jgi:NADH:ubiquinone oxidoreductase subunit C
MTDDEPWRGAALEERAVTIKVQSRRRVFVDVARADFKAVMEWLVTERGFTHVITMTGIDVGHEMEVIYHLAHGALVLSLRVRVSKEDPTVPSIVDLVPGAAFYEREVHDLFGVSFEGNQDLSPLVLPDDWPREIHPLRREWPAERIKRRLEGT